MYGAYRAAGLETGSDCAEGRIRGNPECTLLVAAYDPDQSVDGQGKNPPLFPARRPPPRAPSLTRLSELQWGHGPDPGVLAVHLFRDAERVENLVPSPVLLEGLAHRPVSHSERDGADVFAVREVEAVLVPSNRVIEFPPGWGRSG